MCRTQSEYLFIFFMKTLFVLHLKYKVMVEVLQAIYRECTLLSLSLSLISLRLSAEIGLSWRLCGAPPPWGLSNGPCHTHKGIKAQSLSLVPRRHWQLGQGNNLIWYFMLEKSLSSRATFVLGFSSAPQPPERLHMTLTHFREHYGLKRDLSRQRRGLFVVRASFPACSFGCTLSLHLFAPCRPSPLWLPAQWLASWQVRGFLLVYLGMDPAKRD